MQGTKGHQALLDHSPGYKWRKVQQMLIVLWKKNKKMYSLL